jgi:hypothetical protein
MPFIMTTSHTHSLTATSTGSFARQMLSSGSMAKVIGSTSRGLFLLTPERGIIFLSYETWRSPMSVNLGRTDSELQKVKIGTQTQLSTQKIDILKTGISINLQSAQIWSAPDRPQKLLPPEQRQAHLRDTTEFICEQSSTGFSPLLAAFLDLPNKTSLNQEEQLLLEGLHQLRQAFSIQDLGRAALQSTNLLGYGRGLTPSGDDLLAGLLLALNRWQTALYGLDTGEFLGAINHNLSTKAYTHTTALSANIMTAAAAGQADERLIQSLDALIIGNMPPAGICNLLLRYGASSGIDTLTGFALALSV